MKIAVAGGYGVGLTMTLPRFPAPGETVSGGVLTSGPGGKGSNQAIGAARLGAEVSLFTGLGRDVQADSARELWRREAVDADSVISTDAPTMTGFILLDADGNNSIAIAPGALDELVPDDAETFRPSISAADLVLVSLEIPVAVAHRVMAIAAEEHTSVLLNPAPAAGSLPHGFWSSVNYITPNLGEARELVGRASHDPEAIANDLFSMTEAIVVLTLGGDGAIVADGITLTHVPSVAPAAVVDTTGAGDAFSAALAVAICEGSSPAAAARWAAQAGSFAVARPGVVDALPYRRDLGPLES